MPKVSVKNLTRAGVPRYVLALKSQRCENDKPFRLRHLALQKAQTTLRTHRTYTLSTKSYCWTLILAVVASLRLN